MIEKTLNSTESNPNEEVKEKPLSLTGSSPNKENLLSSTEFD